VRRPRMRRRLPRTRLTPPGDTGFDSVDGNMNHHLGTPPLASLARRNRFLPRVSPARVAAIRPLPEWWVNAARFVLFPKGCAVSRSPIPRPGQRGEPELNRRAFPETEAAMLQHRPRAPIAPWFRTMIVALFALAAVPAVSHADDPGSMRDMPMRRPAARPSASLGETAPGSNSGCAGSACDTVWVGHSNAGPGGAFLGVGVGGVWDFDTGVSGTDSTQGWTRIASRYHLRSARVPSGTTTTATR
jgi:hypothetical protein